MSEKSDKSVVEIVFGSNEVRVKGAEDFVSDELERILDRIDLAQSVEPKEEPKQRERENTPGQQVPLDEQDFRPEQENETTVETDSDPLQKVSERINIPERALLEHFYVEEKESGMDVHIQDPISIPGKIALLGYCTIREELTGTTYHDNQKTKKKLIDVEKVDIDSWGRKFLHRLRKDGLIKDNPNTDKKRNRPFKITPKGRQEFVNFLSE